VLGYDFFHPAKLASPEAEVVRQAHGFEPEFGGQVVSIDVDVWWLIWLMGVKVEPVWA